MLFLILLLGCDDAFTVSSPRCEVRLDQVTPAGGAAGDEAVATGGPFTDRIDTALFLGATRADILQVERTGCDTCDSCREERECGECGECPACGPVCEVCTETVAFSVPAAPFGAQELVLFNAHGSSNALEFTVQEETDTDPDPVDTGGTEPGADSGQP
jgi:hypothetical protein